MTDLELTLACGRYDRTAHLFDGSIKPEGISLSCEAKMPGELFRRMAKFRDFPVAEMSFSTHANLVSRGDDGLVGIPVFPSRAFRHSYVFVNRRAGIKSPQDLIGKRVGTMQYQLTSNLWMRGILEDEYGVRPSDFTWYFGGQDWPGHGERAAVAIPDDIESVVIPDDQTLDGLLAAGDIDALLAPHIPNSFRERHPDVRRLFEDFRTVEADYHRRTRFFPIMHLIVVRRDVYARDPWVAASLFEAFREAKHAALERLQFTGTLAAMVPWLFAELEAAEATFTGHYWPYGVDENRAELQAMLGWARRHGITVSDLEVDDLFAPETLELTCDRP